MLRFGQFHGGPAGLVDIIFDTPMLVWYAYSIGAGITPNGPADDELIIAMFGAKPTDALDELGKALSAMGAPVDMFVPPGTEPMPGHVVSLSEAAATHLLLGMSHRAKVAPDKVKGSPAETMIPALKRAIGWSRGHDTRRGLIIASPSHFGPLTISMRGRMLPLGSPEFAKWCDAKRREDPEAMAQLDALTDGEDGFMFAPNESSPFEVHGPGG